LPTANGGNICSLFHLENADGNWTVSAFNASFAAEWCIQNVCIDFVSIPPPVVDGDVCDNSGHTVDGTGGVGTGPQVPLAINRDAVVDCGCGTNIPVIRIAFDKTDGSCASPGAGNSAHDEISFQLVSPSGTAFTLANSTTWTGNENITPGVVIEFTDTANAPPSGFPTSGAYLATGGSICSAFDGENINGTWLVIPSDNTTGDPLCVSDICIEFVNPLELDCSALTNLSANTDPGVCTAALTPVTPMASGGCAPLVFTNDFNGTDDGADDYPEGTTTLTWTVTDAASNTLTCSIDITVTDTEDPTIVCPADITQDTDVGGCDAAVTVVAPTTSDNCSVASVINDFNSTSDASDTYNEGTTTVLWTVTDDSGNTATCSMDITIEDNEDPDISCPADITASADAGFCDATITYTINTADNCPGEDTTQLSGMGSGVLYPVGMITNSFEVEDASGNTATCSFTVTVTDDEDPTITCPADLTQTADAGSCDAAVMITPATPADNCTILPATLLNDFNSTSDASDTYPVGTTTVTYSVSDSAGNTVSCSFDVTIEDDEDPVLTCAADMTVSTDAGVCTAAVTVPNPTHTDNCPGALMYTNDINGTSDASDTYPIGTTTITFTGTDVAGNMGTCSMDVIVEDNENPTINCPANIAVSTDAGVCTAVVNYSVTSSDNCPSETVTQDAGMASGMAFPLGMTTNDFTVTDGSGNTATCSFTVDVADNELPTVTCPASITQDTDGGSCDAAVSAAAVSFSDNCTPTLTNDFNNTSDASDTYLPGTTTVTYTVSDGSGNMASCSFDVTIEDNEDPTITCPADMTQTADAGVCEAVVTYDTPTTDNCPSETVTQDAGIASGMAFPVGTTTNDFTVTDGSGNTATCSFDVTVTDDEDPAITCPADLTQDTDPGVCTAAVMATGFMTSDNCAVLSFSNDFNSTTDASDTYPLGTTTVTFTSSDVNGNMSTCSFDVTIEDNEDPVITCPSDIISGVDVGTCAAVLAYTVTDSDNCSTTLSQDGGLGSGAAFPVGVTTESYSTTDGSGNVATCSFTITVNDDELPMITCPADITQDTDAGQCDASVAVAGLVATDNCMVASVGNDYNNTSDASDTYALGATIVEFSALDGVGNVSTCSMTITIEDNEGPAIVCPNDTAHTADAGACDAAIGIPAATATDNCGTVTSITEDINGTGDASSTYPVGATTVTFTATDDGGNTSTCTMVVTITDDEDPMLVCPADMTVSNDIGSCDAAVTVPGATVSDNCAINTLLNDYNNTSDASDTYVVGTTVIEFSAEDVSGNVSTCMMSITVEDDEDPTFSGCPSDMSMDPTDFVNCTAVATWTPPTEADNCGVMSVTSTHNSGDTFVLGTTTVMYTATDTAGNTGVCSFDITVNEAGACANPTISCNPPPFISTQTDAGICGAAITIPDPTVTNGAPPVTVTNSFNGNSNASDVYPPGFTQVTYTATDAGGNTATCSHFVSVSDDEDPVISCADVTSLTDQDECGANVTVPAPTASDNCAIIATNNDYNNGPDASDFYDVGTTTVEWRVQDAAGNMATCSFNVIVTDMDPPKYNACPADITMSNDVGVCTAVVTWGDPNLTENCVLASSGQTHNSGDTFPLGETTVTYSAQDTSGNTAICSFNITVEDDEDPTITCPSDISQSNDIGSCDAAVTVPAPTVTDNCSANPTNDYNGIADASDTYPLGMTAVVFTATDTAGNTATCSFNITITDDENPMITCPSDITQTADTDSCNAAVMVPAPTYMDNCNIDVVINDYNSTSDASDTYPVGMSIVGFTVADSAGNTATCSFNIMITDDQMPMITCPADITQATDLDSCNAMVTVPTPTFMDNCPGTTIMNDYNSTSDASDIYPEGTTTVTFTATDAAANTMTCSLDIMINDEQDPTITCPSDMTQTADANMCSAAVTVPAPMSDDNCAVMMVMNDYNSTSDASDTYNVGTTSVTYTATDNSGNTASCDFSITITDDEMPTVTCPADMTQTADAGSCSAAVTVPALTAMDNCGVMSVTNDYNNTDDASDTYNVGTSSVTFTATDTAGNMASCVVMITITDDEDPTVSCPTDITQSNDPGVCAAAVTVPAPMAMDNCGIMTVMNDFNSTSDASDTYDVGTTTVTFTVADTAGNTATCSLDITIEDNEAPVITCPSSITQSNDTDSCNAAVTVATITVDENCALMSIVNDYNNGSDASDTYPVGTTTVVFTVTDSASNSSSCSLDVTVEDDQDPVITCPADATMANDAGACEALVTIPLATASDNCAALVTNDYTSIDDATDIYPVGTTTVTFTATDAASNIATCSITVTVTDDEDPTITCPADITQTADPDACDAVVAITSPTGADNCNVASVMNDYNSTSDASDTYPVGTTPVVWTATDDAGNTGTCMFNVMVTDDQAPDITCPADMTADTDAGNCDASLTVMNPTATDNCGTVTFLNDYNNTSDASDTYAAGVTVVNFSALDGAGNASTCMISITVEDNEDPTITCPSSITQGSDLNECDALVTVPAPTFGDNCDSFIENDFNSTSDASDTYPVGTTAVMFTVSDSAGNTATCSLDITVEDDENPVYSFCPSDITVSNDAGSCDAVVTWDPVLVGDNCSIAVFNTTHNSGDTFVLGTTTVMYTASDPAGNTRVCIFNVTVEDDEDPIITCPTDITQPSDAGNCDAAVMVPVPAFSDNCFATIANDQNGTMDASGTYPVGTTTVTWTATDSVGNTASCSTDIIVEDLELPMITCPANMSVSATTGACNANVVVTSAMTSDNCGVAMVVNDYNSTSDASDNYPVGTTAVMFTVTDIHGNSSSCSMDITVTDDEAPFLFCPSDIAMDSDAGECGANVSIPSPPSSDNCGLASIFNDFNNGIDASDLYPVGTTTVTFTAGDVNGNISTCDFDVTITDIEIPVITCPNDTTVDTDATICKTNMTFSAPPASDNCGVMSVMNDYNNSSDASDNYFPGTTTVTWTATDDNGLTASCSFNVTVEDNADPLVFCPTDVVVPADSGDCGAVVFVPAAVTADNCNVASITNDYNSTSDATDSYTIGSTTVTFTVTDDAGNSASCAMTVTVEDTQMPDIVCPADVTGDTDAGNCDAMVTVGAPTSGDNCGVISATNDFNSTSDASDVYPLGATTVVWTASDAGGNTTTCSMTVTVSDDEDPALTCPSDINVMTDAGQCSAALTIPAATVTDNCSVAAVTNNFNNTSDASGTYPSGSTTVIWTAIDASSNIGTCSMTVTVNDMESPVMTGCPSDMTVGADDDTCSAVVTWTEPVSTDNCGITSSNNSHSSGDSFPVGTTTVTYDVADASGNTAGCSFVITVEDDQAPELVLCPQDIDVVVGLSCDAEVSMPVPLAQDNCGLASLINDFNNTTNGSGTYQIGLAVVTWTATDIHGNTATCSLNVNVEDTDAPDIVCPSDMLVSADPGQCSAFINMLPPVFGDNCPGSSATNNFNGGSDASDLYPVGATEVIWTVTDASDNSSACSFFITVEDNEAPVLDCQSITVFADTTTGTAAGFPDVSFSDNCAGATIAYAPVGPYTVGTHSITATVTDASGNMSTCDFFLNVVTDACGRDVFEDNDEMSDAKELPAIGVNLNAQICQAGDVDWFWWVVGEKNNVAFSLTHLRANLHLEVFDASMTSLGLSDSDSLRDEAVVLNDQTFGDTLYIRVFGATPAAFSNEGYNLHAVARDVPFSSLAFTKDVVKGDIEETISVNLYPNPAREYVNVSIDGLSGLTHFVLYNAAGQIVMKEEWNIDGAEIKELNISVLPEGVYFYQLRSKDYQTSGEIVRMD